MDPIVVDSTAASTLRAVILRYLLTTIGTYLVASGKVSPDSLPGIMTIVGALAVMAYGTIKSFLTKKHLIIAAESADNDVATVEGNALKSL